MKLFNFIDGFNGPQKVALLITSGICFFLLALHNPFGGYNTETTYYYLCFWNYSSINAVSEYVHTIGQFVGLLIPTLMFGFFAVRVLRQKHKSDAEQTPEEDKS